MPLYAVPSLMPSLPPREFSDEEVFGTQGSSPAPSQAPNPAPSLAQQVVGPAPTLTLATPTPPREFTDDEVFGTQAPTAPKPPTPLGERFKVNAQEGLDNSLIGEVRAQAQSGRFEERAADTLRAEIDRQRYMLQAMGPQITPEARAAVERDIAAMEAKIGGLQYDAAAKRPAFEVEEAQKAQRGAAVTPWTQEPGMVNKAVAGVTALIGQLIGGAPSPENFVGGSGGNAVATGAKGVAERFARGFAANAPVAATANVATQSMQEDRGARDEFSVVDMLLAGGAGGTIGGSIHAGPEAARQIWSLVRGKLAGRRGVAPDAITPDSVTAADAEALRLDPEVKAALDQFGATPSSPESAQAMADRIARRREQDAQGRADLTTDDVPRYRGAAENVRADAEAVKAGDVDPGAAAPPPRRTEPPPVIVPERAVDQGTQAGVDLRGKSNLPAVVERQPERLTPEEVTRARADMEGGQPRGAAADDTRPRAETNMTAPPDRAPQTPDDVQSQREAAQAFNLKERQNARAGEGVADTQPAGRPEGFDAKTVHLDEGFPVEIVSRRMVPDAKGNMIDVATVRRYDPRTGKAEPDAVEYEVPARQLKTKQYATAPRQAQDFRDRAESPAGEKLGLPEQTYRKTPADTNEQFPGAASGGHGEPPAGRGPHSGRSPYPDQPEGPHPGPQRASTEEELIRRARQREQEQARNGTAREQPRPDDGKASSREKGKDRDGHWVVDDRGFVVSDKGGPIRFGDHKQAAKWILNVGQAEPSRQHFEIANHPSGKGYTARELGRTKPEDTPPGGGARPDESGAPKSSTDSAASNVEPRAIPGTKEKDNAAAAGQQPESHIRQHEGIGGHVQEQGKDRQQPAGEPQGRDQASSGDFVSEGGKEPVRSRTHDDILIGTLSPRKADVAKAYGVSEREAAEILDYIYRRPDSPFELAAGKNAGIEDVTYRRMNADRREARIRENADWAYREFGLRREDYKSDREFFDAVERRMDRRDAIKRAEEMEAAERAKIEEMDRAYQEYIDSRGDAWEPGSEERTPRTLRDLEAENEAIQRSHPDTGEGRGGAARPESTGKPAEGDGVHRGPGERRGVDEKGGGSEESGGSTLFSGPEGKAIAEAASLIGRATGGLTSTIRENWNVALKNLTGGGRAKSPRGAVKDIAQTLVYSNDGYLRALSHDYKSPTIAKVADMFFAASGKADSTARTYGEAVTQHTQRRFNQLEEILGPFGKNEKDLNRITELVQKPGLIKDGTPLGDAARKLQALLKDELKYAREAGIDVGEIKSGYFPREINREMVQLDPEGFTAAAKRVYQRMGLDPKDAAAMADHWRQVVISGDMGTKIGGNDFIAIAGAMPTPKNVRARTLPKEADEILRPFLLQNPADVLSSYFTRMSRRAEWARRMGDDLSKWKELKQAMIDEGATAAVPDVVKHIQSITGTMPVSIGRLGSNAISWLQVWNTVGLLPKATISSLSEVIVPAIRSGNTANILRSIGLTARSLAKTEGTHALRELAEDIGIVGQVGHDLLMAQRFGGVSDSKAAQFVTNQFFLRTGLHQFTEATRVASLGVGQMFIRRLALDVANERPRAASSRLLLKEMGVPDGELKSFAEWVKRADKGKPTKADLSTDEGHAATYRTAIARFVDQSIMNTKTVERPYFANHPIGRLAYNLMSYLYSFQKNVLNRSGNMARAAVTEKGLTLADRATLAAPAMMLPMLLASAFGISEAREAVLGDPTRKRDNADRFMLALSRSSLTGVADWLVNAYQGVRYERDPATAMAGPALGRILDGVKSFVELTNSKNSPNTNAAERRFAKTIYDLIVEPAANAALSIQPVPYVGAAGIQAVSSGSAREAFVGAVAGEKPPERASRK